MKLKKENDLKKNCEAEFKKRWWEREWTEKESEQKKESEKKIESGKNERKTKKQGSFYAKASDVKNVFFIQTSLYLYSCTKMYVLILTNLTIFVAGILVDCHLLEE